MTAADPSLQGSEPFAAQPAGRSPKGSVILGREPQDVFIEPARAHKTVLERWHGRKDAGEPVQHSVVDVRGRHDGEEHG